MANRFEVERVDWWIVQDRVDGVVHWLGRDYDTAQEVKDALNDEAARYEPGGDLADEEGTW